MAYHDGFMFEERIITNLNIFLERVVCLGLAVVYDTLMRIISGDRCYSSFCRNISAMVHVADCCCFTACRICHHWTHRQGMC